MTAPMGGWSQTQSGRAYHFERPTPAMINIVDIAHALSHLCRFGGHTSRFYSVAEHSVLVSYEVPAEHALAGLMHDATEAYVVDIPRPLKHLLGQVYADLEQKAWLAICDKFGLDPELHPSIKEADNTVLLAERDVLLRMPTPLPWTWAKGIEPADVTIEGLSPKDAKAKFLARFLELQ